MDEDQEVERVPDRALPLEEGPAGSGEDQEQGLRAAARAESSRQLVEYQRTRLILLVLSAALAISLLLVAVKLIQTRPADVPTPPTATALVPPTATIEPFPSATPRPTIPSIVPTNPAILPPMSPIAQATSTPVGTSIGILGPPPGVTLPPSPTPGPLIPASVQPGGPSTQ